MRSKIKKDIPRDSINKFMDTVEDKELSEAVYELNRETMTYKQLKALAVIIDRMKGLAG